MKQLFFLFLLTTNLTAGELFDMDALRDSSTLDGEVLQDWHLVAGHVPTRQKLITINVGEIWPGQTYRVPVRMIVPAEGKARGFHLTGGNSPPKLEQDAPIFELERDLIAGGIGLVKTVVQEPGAMGLRELGDRSEARFLQSLDPHDKVQYWAWPATMMRAITAAHAETEHFHSDGKVAMSGGSKNGATPSMAIIHDERMTAVMGSVSPIWDSPLRLCNREAWDELRAEVGDFRHPFLGGHYGPIFNRRALEAGRTWEDLQRFTADVSDSVFLSRNLEALRARRVAMLFHPGTHDFVAFDLAWGGAHHPDIPIYLAANTGHGVKGRHPQTERNNRNSSAFILRHFFPDEIDPLLSSPKLRYEKDGSRLTVRVQFPEGAGDESGRMFWIYDRPPDGSPGYIRDLIPEENSVEMKRDDTSQEWVATIELDLDRTRVDFFTNHRKTLRFRGKDYPTYLSSAYTRVSW
ncbi:MAG: hypothetical protein AAGH89_04820 [Verrucomicrobiota bacterium]